jgi:hypothetical protein
MASLTSGGIRFSLTDFTNIIESFYWIYPAGTKKVFYQAEAPTGWVKDTTQNNKMLKVVSGSGGVSGGTISASNAFISTGTEVSFPFAGSYPASGTVGNTTLSLGQLPNHTHEGTMGSNGGSSATPFSNAGSRTVFGSAATSGMIESTGGGSHTHPWSGTLNLNANITGTTDLSVQYVDVIICTLS